MNADEVVIYVQNGDMSCVLKGRGIIRHDVNYEYVGTRRERIDCETTVEWHAEPEFIRTATGEYERGR